MSDVKIPAAPKGSSARAKKLWRSVLADYELLANELEVLRECCSILTEMEAIDDFLRDQPRLVDGYRPGMKVSNPEATRRDKLRLDFLKLSQSLNIREADSALDGIRPKDATKQAAAQARWGVRP